jgi:hypothetical protein
LNSACLATFSHSSVLINFPLIVSTSPYWSTAGTRSTQRHSGSNTALASPQVYGAILCYVIGGPGNRPNLQVPPEFQLSSDKNQYQTKTIV